MQDKKTCPACGRETMHAEEAMNSLSRYHSMYICSDCGTREAFDGDFWGGEVATSPRRMYKIEVNFSRVFSLFSEDQHKAEEVARARAWADLQNDAQEGKPPYSLRAGEYEEPTRWNKEAEELGESIADDLADEIAEVVKLYKEKNADEIKEEKDAGNEYDSDSDAVGEIWDDLYQDEDISDRAWQSADGYFIYTNTRALIRAMECIDELSGYSSGDSGLWEGVQEYERIIQIQATDALQGAVMSEAETAIKNKIAEALNA